MKLKTILLALTVMVASINATAQSTSTCGKKNAYPHMFVGLQVGGQTTFTQNYDQLKLITPIAGVSFGAHFSPVVGARLHVSGVHNMDGIEDLGTYKYKYASGNLDLMLNMANLFAPNRKCHLVDPYLLGGAGLAYLWDNKQTPAMAMSQRQWADNRLVGVFRVGAMVEFNVSRLIGLNIEVDANNYHTIYTPKQTARGDWQLAAYAGISFRFGHKKAKCCCPAPVVEQPAPVVVEEPAPVVVEEPAPVVVEEPAPVVEPAKTRVNIFFELNKSVIQPSETAKIKELAEWLKQHPTAKLTLTGYADAGTGTRTINNRLASERAKVVTRQLVDVYGIEESRISTDSKGDAVQPFAQNDDNRVVICLGAE